MSLDADTEYNSAVPDEATPASTRALVQPTVLK